MRVRLFQTCILALACVAAPAAARREPPAPPPPLVFAGIPWLTPADSALARLEARGWRPVKNAHTADVVVCQGRFYDHVAVVRGALDEERRIVQWTLDVAPPDVDTVYAAMRRVYDDAVAELQARHGAPWDLGERYEFPYARGDGREQRALANGMARIYSVWRTPRGEMLRIDMDHHCGVRLVYASPEWTALETRRRARGTADL